MRALGVEVRVAALDDLIAMKRAAGRPMDRIELEILGRAARGDRQARLTPPRPSPPGKPGGLRRHAVR